MAIDIFSIEPSPINKSLAGKTILLAGAPKVGKSEFCAQSEKTLILDFEGGYKAHPGVLKLTITKWAEIKQVVRQLERPEAKEKYINIAFDTISEAWDCCTAYICSQAGVQKINEIPYGGGYKARDDEFASVLRKIINLDFGLILTCHIKETIIGTDESGVDITTLAPDVDKRCLPIINGLVDIIGIIQQTWEGNESKRWLLTKATPTIKAGSRWATLAPRIPFGYKYLEDAVAKAIEEAGIGGAQIVEQTNSSVETIDFDSLFEEARTLWGTILNVDENNIAKLQKKIEIIFGHPMKLSEVTEDQVSLLELMVIEMRDMIKKI